MRNPPLLIKRSDRFGPCPFALGGADFLEGNRRTDNLDGVADHIAAIVHFADDTVTLISIETGNGFACPAIWAFPTSCIVQHVAASVLSDSRNHDTCSGPILWHFVELRSRINRDNNSLKDRQLTKCDTVTI